MIDFEFFIDFQRKMRNIIIDTDGESVKRIVRNSNGHTQL